MPPASRHGPPAGAAASRHPVWVSAPSPGRARTPSRRRTDRRRTPCARRVPSRRRGCPAAQQPARTARRTRCARHTRPGRSPAAACRRCWIEPIVGEATYTSAPSGEAATADAPPSGGAGAQRSARGKSLTHPAGVSAPVAGSRVNQASADEPEAATNANRPSALISRSARRSAHHRACTPVRCRRGRRRWSRSRTPPS